MRRFLFLLLRKFIVGQQSFLVCLVEDGIFQVQAALLAINLLFGGQNLVGIV